jgi:hypothetical protein
MARWPQHRELPGVYVSEQHFERVLLSFCHVLLVSLFCSLGNSCIRCVTVKFTE